MNKALKLLIVDDMHNSLMNRLDQLGISFSYQPTIQRDQIIEELKSYSGIIVRSKINLNAEFLSSQPQLKFIARAGSGMDNVDLDAAEKRGILCINAAEANADAVGEHAVGLMLALKHRIVKSNREVVQYVWDREGNRGGEIKNSTVGIIGYGNTGSAVARKLAGFGCKIVAYDKYKSDFSEGDVNEVSLEQLMAEADVISFHIPLTSETKNWINLSWIEAAGKKFILLNLSRGGIMETKAVIQGLNSGKIKSFATDVLENERLQSFNSDESQDLTWLNDQDNVIVTPHVAGWSQESYVKISGVLANKVEAYVKGKKNMADYRHDYRQIVG
ncbi:MAG: D-3-phosphoglycerate dehydrogenase [Bacteroidia bacterium]|jgi:D-3-phosphoglycerate dehydrogenase